MKEQINLSLSVHKSWNSVSILIRKFNENLGGTHRSHERLRQDTFLDRVTQTPKLKCKFTDTFYR